MILSVAQLFFLWNWVVPKIGGEVKVLDKRQRYILAKLVHSLVPDEI